MEELRAVIEKTFTNTTGMIIVHKGKKVFEEYFNECNENTALHVFSVTKSIMGLLIGKAIEEGKIQSIDDKLLSFFPEYLIKTKEETLQQVTLKDLLTMTVPYRYKFNPYTKYFSAEDQVLFSLKQVGGKFGKLGVFRYSPLIGPDILSGIIRNVSGMSVKEYAKQTLFEPLGIGEKADICFASKDEQMDYYKRTDYNGWVCDRKGNYNAGWGLHLTAREMAAIGEMMRNHGVYDGKPILSEDWIIDSTTAKINHTGMPAMYGYLWWIIDGKERAYAALGDGGNTIYVNESKELVVVINGKFRPREKDRIGFIRDVIEDKVD